MLKSMQYLNYNANYSYCPPSEDCVINTDQVTSAYPCESRYGGKTMLVRFTDGTRMTVIGEPKDLLDGGT